MVALAAGSRPRLLITGLFEPAALAVIRRLGREGWHITAAEGHRMAYGLYSRYVAQRRHLPSLRLQPQAYVKALLREISSGAYDFYFPTFEEVLPLSRARDEIAKHVATVLPSPEQVFTFHDKWALGELARRAGVGYPKTWLPQSVEEVTELGRAWEGPVVVKLRRGSGSAGMRKVERPEDLPRVYREVVQAYRLKPPLLPLVQRWIEGTTICSLELAQRGKVVGQILIRGLRTMPRDAGTTVLRECLRHPACEEASRKLIGALDYTGFVGFDYVVEKATGQPYVVDGNPRPTPALNLAQLGGCDMVGAWVRIAQGEEAKSLSPCPPGLRTRVHFGDWAWLLESLAHSFRHPREEARLRRGWWRDRRTPDDVYDRRDPLPAVVLWLYIFTHLHRLVLTSYDSTELFMFHNRYVESVEEGEAQVA